MKHYLGDGVYIDEWSDGGLVLTTEDGINTTNTIYLEPEVIDALVRYLEGTLIRHLDAAQPPE